jgi:hypothetical protein
MSATEAALESIDVGMATMATCTAVVGIAIVIDMPWTFTTYRRETGEEG